MKLVAYSGPLVGQELTLPVDRPIIIGRASGADIQLADSQVSRRHAEVRVAGGEQVTITDAGSSNGTFVNGERIQGARVLRPGDTIHIGETQFVLRRGTATVSMSSGLAEPPPVASSRPNLALIVGGVAALVLLVIAAAVGFLIMQRGSDQIQGSKATSKPGVAQVTLTAIQQPTRAAASTPTPGVSTPTSPTPTSLVELFVTFTPPPVSPTVVVPTRTRAPVQPINTPQAPPFTVSWSPGRYEGWAEGRRMSTDLAIQNNNLPEIKPPYTPYMIISDAKGKMRQADLQDYGGSKGPPTIPKGQKLVWTWFGVMSNREWVRGSVFRYAGYAWAQEFNPDGSLNGPPRVIDEKQLIPFLPKETPPELLPTLVATLAAGGMPTGIPTGLPTGIPTGIPTGVPKP